MRDALYHCREVLAAMKYAQLRSSIGAVLCLSGLLVASPALAVEQYTARLAGHAILPAQTVLPPPADAPDTLAVSGRFAGGGALREDRLFATEGESFLSDDAAPRSTGIYLPFAGQPVQGFSGIRALGDDAYLVLTDNGFGSKANSPDALLMVHHVHPDWAEGRVDLRETLFLSDPDRIVPFRIVNEHTETRYLTGADFDPESIQPVGDRYWIGDEFGPYLFAVDRDGKVVAFTEVRHGGAVLRSPDHHAVGMPGSPGSVAFDVRRSRGFEGMALSTDRTTLYPMLEGPLWDGEAGGDEKVDGRPFLRILAFDLNSGTFTDDVWRYPLTEDGNVIGDFNMIDDRRALVIERDGGEGDSALACRNGARPDCFNRPAVFKRVYLIDMNPTDDGFVQKLGFIDLLDIADPDGLALRGAADGRFTFPFVTIENVDRVDDRHIIVANDNNFPFSSGRTIGAADDNEFILLEVADFLQLRAGG